ncbi:MAG: carboxy terminal-processing peptidase [Saprospiraceae bacterium]|nr:carboxy terminal-processing peptidase [Saprospiraceae bacterium]
MIYKSSVVLALILGFVGFKSMQPTITGDDKESLIISAMLQYVDNVHFAPKPIDDELSKFVFKTYLERVDGGKRYFTQGDIDQLNAHQLQIDDQINRRSFEFFNQSLGMLEKRMALAETYYNEIIDQPFDLNQNRKIELDEEKKPYAKDEAQLKQYWKDFLTYEVITRLDRKMDEQADSKENKEPKKSEAELLEDVRKDIKKTFGDWFNRLRKFRRSDRFESYVGSISNYFDPHTDFFNPKEKQDFDINMGGKLEGIGARLQQDGDYIKVSDIVTGGPAWKGKELEANDIILSAAQEGKEPVELAGMRVDDAVTHIRGKKGTKVTLTVKKQDGTVKQITITRDEVILDESFARSVIFDMPGVINNIGYIKLPKFYSSFENENGNSCAVDVAREVEKLKENKVNGIILDLRNNTGGSLNDVVDMSGLFIEQGPIVQVKSRQAKPYVHQDRDSRVQYDGPLIIMVNSMSASASEIIAAAMQDYGRAVIVGSASTFGKGSVQRFFDLDKAVSGSEDLKPLGEIKMTVQKFYRVNGGSTQLKGVVPDVVLPDNYMYIDVGEKEYENAMEWTEIAPQSYAQQVVKMEHLSSIIEKSKKRVAGDERFKSVQENAKRLKKNRDESVVNLSLKDYRAQMDVLEKEAKKYEELYKTELKGFGVKNLPQDLAGIDADESKKARNEDWFKEMKKDFYLTETMNVMKDMIIGEKSFTYLVEKIK